MRRFSLGRLMAVVALLAANLALGRYLLTRDGDATMVSLVGLIPLANAHLISMYILVGRYRIVIRRRDVRFVPLFVVASSLALVATFVVCLLFPVLFLGLVELIWGAIDGYLPLRSIPEDSAIALLVPLLGAVVSGPPLLLAAVVSFVLGRFQLVITLRVPTEEPCADSRLEA